MAGVEVANAYVSILPKSGGNFKQVAQNASNQFGSTFKSGISAWGVAAGNVLASALQSTIGSVGEILGESIKYSDALTRFPLVLESLGISGDKAADAISRLRAGLEGTPIIVSDATTAVQRLVATTGDVEKSTDWFLALTDAVLAGAAPYAVQQAAIEQWQQAVAKGKPDRIEFRSFMQAFPGVMQQVSKKLGITTADLQKMFSDNKITMQEFNEILVDLDRNGIAGFKNLKEQARSALVGIDTGFALIRKSFIETFGQMFLNLNISGQVGVFQDIGRALANAMTTAFSGATDAIQSKIRLLLDILAIRKGTFIGPITDEMQQAVEKFNNFVNMFKFGTQAVGQYFTEMSNILANGGFESLMNLITPLIRDLAILAGAVLKVVEGIVALAKEFPGLTKVIGETIGVVITFKVGIGGLSKLFSRDLGAGAGLFVKLFRTIRTDMTKTNAVLSKSKGVFQSLKTLWSGPDLSKAYQYQTKEMIQRTQYLDEVLGKSSKSIGKSVNTMSNETQKATKTLKTTGVETQKVGKSFGQLAGSALQILAIGGAITIASYGFKNMADAASEIAESGPLAAGALAIMGGILIGFTAVVGTLGKALQTTWPQLLALGGAIALAGAGFLLFGIAAEKVASAGPGALVALGLMGGILIGLIVVLGVFGPALDVATPFVLAFGAAILMAGAGIGLAAAGIGVLAMGFAQLAQQLPIVAEYGLQGALGLAAMAGSLYLLASGALSLIAPLGIAVVELGLFTAASLLASASMAALMIGFMSAALGASFLATILSTIRADAEATATKLWELQGSVDIVGNALNSLSEIADSVVNNILGFLQGLAGNGTQAMWDLWNNCLIATQQGGSNVINAVQEIINGVNERLWTLADNGYWQGARLGEEIANGIRSQKSNIWGAINEIAQMGQNFTISRPQFSTPTSNYMLQGAQNGANGLIDTITMGLNLINPYKPNKQAFAYASAGQPQVVNNYVNNFNGTKVNDNPQIRELTLQLHKEINRKAQM